MSRASSAQGLTRAQGASLAAGLLVVVLVRTVGLMLYPNVAADEGGWLLSVREWAEQGLITFDFHTAPGFHLILGSVFRLLEPTLPVARAFSALCGLLSIGLFALWVRQLLPARDAWWAVLLLGTLTPLVAIDRSGLIEPVAFVFVHASMVFLVGRGRWALIGLTAATAAALLTKANTGAIFAALVIGMAIEARTTKSADRGPQVLALFFGAVVAGLGYLYLYRLDPATFMLGWGNTIGKPMLASPPGVPRLGRFVLPLGTAADTLVFLARQGLLLFVAGLAAALLAVRRRQHLPFAVWGLTAIPFVLIQIWQSPQYLVAAYPPLVLFAVWLTSTELPNPPRIPGRASVWRWVILSWSLALLARGLLLQRDPTAEAIHWLQDHRSPDQGVIAAPYVVMQLPSPGISHFSLAPSFLPDAERLHDLGAVWVLVDDREWLPRLVLGGGTIKDIDTTLAECCVLRFDTPAARVYRVRPFGERPALGQVP